MKAPEQAPAFVLFGLILMLVTSLVDAATLTGRIWAERTFNISTGDLVSTSVGPDDWEAAFNTAAARWNAVVPFTVTTDTNTANESCDPNDPNTTFFSATRCGNAWPQNVVGVSSTWASTHNGHAFQTSIVFNSNRTWDVFDGPLGGPDVEFTRVAVHEIGHSIGLDHTADGDAIMFPSSSNVIDPAEDDKAGTLLLYGEAQSVGLSDINISGDAEVAVMRPRLSDRRAIVEIRETDGSLVRKNFYRPGYDPTDLVRLADFSGNNIVELGVLHKRISDGRTMVEIRDASTGTTVNNAFYSPGSTAMAAVVLDDVNGGGGEEVAVLQVRDSDERVIVEVRDAATATLIKKIFYTFNYWPLELAVVPDLNGNGADEIAVLMVRRSDLRLRVQVRDSLTGALLVSPFHPPGYSGLPGIAVVDDISGNGIPEIASLSVRDSDGRVAVRLHDAQTGATVRLLLYLPGSTVVAPNAMTIFPDNSGNGVQEIGVLVQRDSDERALLQIRDATTAAITRNVWVPGVDGEVLAGIPTINGGVSDEAVVLGFNANFKSQARVYDSDSGAQLIIINFAVP